MNELIEKIAEILEEDTVDTSKKFTDYEAWDSLAALTLIATLDSDYKKTMRTNEILSYETIGDFCKAIVG